MEVKMRWEKKMDVQNPLAPLKNVTVELRGRPSLVERLKEVIVDFMREQPGFNDHY